MELQGGAGDIHTFGLGLLLLGGMGGAFPLGRLGLVLFLGGSITTVAGGIGVVLDEVLEPLGIFFLLGSLVCGICCQLRGQGTRGRGIWAQRQLN